MYDNVTYYDNHILQFREEGDGTVAYYSIYEPEQLLVFVHGFGGNAVRTWRDFPICITNYSVFRNTDVIFYGYNSGCQVGNSASSFSSHLQSMITPPLSIEGYERLQLPIRYKKIILVGHSMGAIVIRRALLFIKESGDDTAINEWLPLTKMILFAPAHKGSRNIVEYAMECLPGMSKVIGVFAKYYYPAISDLIPNSEVLQTIKEKTIELLKEKKGDFTKASVVVWAMNDKIVINEVFCGDCQPGHPPEDKNHVAVCKPNIRDNYIKPLDLIINALKSV